jgi:hypothetical protein
MSRLGVLPGQPLARSQRLSLDQILPQVVTLNRSINGYNVVTATSGGTAHTMGSWVEALAAAPAQGNLLRVYYGSNNADNTNTASLFDVSIGPGAGSEVATIQSIQCGHAVSSLAATGGTSAITHSHHDFLVNIPAGARIAIRTQGARTSNGQLFAVEVWNIPALGVPQSKPITMGVNTAESRGVNIPTHANGWAEIVAATPAPLRGIMVVIGANGASGLSNPTFTVDVAIGAAGSEVTIFQGALVVSHATVEILRRSDGASRILPVNLPPGVRLAIRRADAGNNNGTSATCGTIVGFPA